MILTLNDKPCILSMGCFLLTSDTHGLQLCLPLEPLGRKESDLKYSNNMYRTVLYSNVFYNNEKQRSWLTFFFERTLFSTSSVWAGPSAEPERLLRLKAPKHKGSPLMFQTKQNLAVFKCILPKQRNNYTDVNLVFIFQINRLGIWWSVKKILIHFPQKLSKYPNYKPGKRTCINLLLLLFLNVFIFLSYIFNI